MSNPELLISGRQPRNHVIPMAILRVRSDADLLAIKQAQESRRRLLSHPLTAAYALGVRANVKFFRRLAGLRNGDVQ